MNVTLEMLLLEAQRLLNEANEANSRGDYSTFVQRQAREVLAAAIDALNHNHIGE